MISYRTNFKKISSENIDRIRFLILFGLLLSVFKPNFPVLLLACQFEL